MTSQKPITLEEILGQLARSQDEKTICQAHTSLAQLKTARAGMEQVLGSLLDPVAFYVQYVPSRYDFAEGLKKAYQQIQKESVGDQSALLRGAVGLACFMLELLDEAGRKEPTLSPTPLEWPRELLSDPAVRRWFSNVYKPTVRRNHTITSNDSISKEEKKKNLELSQRFWRELDLQSLELYRVGTTSFILRCQVHILAGECLVLKCLLFPYTRIASIAESTCEYAVKYAAGIVPATARVRSSTEKWILMDYIEGLTLQEYLQDRKNTEGKTPPFLRTDVLTSIGKPLFDALCALSGAGFRHEDLTPSNIIVTRKPDGSVEKVVLIDLGRNYLYTRKIGLAAGREALFVAPEVKEGKSIDTSDVYSLGMLLAELAVPQGAQRGIIPESIYQYASPLARFLEDLIDENPKHRLLLFHSEENKEMYPNLSCIFENLLKILPSDRELKPGPSFWVQQMTSLLRPSDQLKDQWKLWKLSRSSSIHRAISKHSARLYTWSFACTCSFYLIFFVSLIWGLRDFGLDEFPFFVNIMRMLFPDCGNCVPGIDALRAPDYTIPNLLTNLPARLVGLSFCFVGVKYYQNILSGLTAKPIHGKLAWVTECFLRYKAISALPLVLIANFHQPGWWLELTILGYAIVIFSNIFCYQLAIRTLKKAREVLSTTPLSDDPSLKMFGQWGPTMIIYGLVLLGTWTGLWLNFFHDVWVFVMTVVAINIYLCLTRCIHLAPNVRGSLSRAFIAGERLEALARHTNHVSS